MSQSQDNLDYEPTASRWLVCAEREGDTTRISVSMPSLYVPVPHWALNLDLFSLVIVPPIWLAILVFRSILRLPNPPRAVFEISREHFRMRLWEVSSNKASDQKWPRAAVAEVRANRFARGLWVDIAGHVKDTFLNDLPSETIEQLASAIASALDFAKP